MSNTEYPKMLYKGDKHNYANKIVANEAEETTLRDDGFCDYADLKDAPQIPQEVKENTPNDEQVETLKAELAKAQAENERLNAIIENGIAENKALQEQLDTLQGLSSEPSDKVDYSDWTKDELQEEITKRGLDFKTRDTKDDLIAILEA